LREERESTSGGAHQALDRGNEGEENGGGGGPALHPRGGGGLDARCAEGGRQLRVSDGGGNGREARGQGREAADVQACGHSTKWQQNLIQNQSSNRFKLYSNSFKL
jgi:hypothetical protein